MKKLSQRQIVDLRIMRSCSWWSEQSEFNRLYVVGVAQLEISVDDIVSNRDRRLLLSCSKYSKKYRSKICPNSEEVCDHTRTNDVIVSL